MKQKLTPIKKREPQVQGGKGITSVKSQVPPESGIQFTVQAKQALLVSTNQPAIQKKENKTGMPDSLKSGLENMSGIDLSDVKVHYNSLQPAQLNAHAYAQGNEIHIAPGQEKHLPHEGWHVVQQKQGRVKPTKQLKSTVPINDNPSLEKEADVMGAKVLNQTAKENAGYTKQLKSKGSKGVIQRQEINKRVTGITHLVKMEGGSIYNEDFLKNEVMEVENGDIVLIDTDVKYMSRRGPNQEKYNATDKTGSQHYKWFKVISVNGKKVDKDVFIREGTTVDARLSVREILLEKAQSLGINPHDFENSLQSPESNVVATSSVKSLQDLPNLAGLTIDKIRDLTFKEFYQFLMKNNLLTGSCGQTSDMLTEAVTGGRVAAPQNKSIDAAIHAMLTCHADPWYCRVMVDPHSFMVERIGNIGRIYQSYFGHYTMMSKLVEDHAYPIHELLGMIRIALNQNTSTAVNRQAAFHARAMFTSSAASYELITNPVRVEEIAHNIEARFGERTKEWQKYFTDHRSMKEINPTPVHDASLDTLPQASYDFACGMDEPLSTYYTVFATGKTSPGEFEAASNVSVEKVLELNAAHKLKGFVLSFNKKEFAGNTRNIFVFGGRALKFGDVCVRFVRIDTSEARDSGNLP